MIRTAVRAVRILRNARQALSQKKKIYMTENMRTVLFQYAMQIEACQTNDILIKDDLTMNDSLVY